MERNRTSIVAGSHLGEYFRDGLQRAMLNQGLQVAETTEFYVVSLLLQFEKLDSLYVRSEKEKFEEEPLAVMYVRALEGDKGAQVRAFKKMGDIALYISGFFSEHLDRGAVGRGYYVDMGSSAYGSLAAQFSGEKVFFDLYSELSDRFIDIVYVLEEFRLTHHIGDNVALLNLYERWLKTKDEKLKAKLIKEGLIPRETSKA